MSSTEGGDDDKALNTQSINAMCPLGPTAGTDVGGKIIPLDKKDCLQMPNTSLERCVAADNSDSNVRVFVVVVVVVAV